MNVGQLERAVGGLGTPSKMPGLAYGLPAPECQLGSILRRKAVSVCEKCYAMRGNYTFPAPRNAQYRRLAIIRKDIKTWQRNMTSLLDIKLSNKRRLERYFRWHDSGDLQSPEHFKAIIEIAKALPRIRFWLPTKERAMIQSYKGKIPNNLIVRLSAPMMGQYSQPPKGFLSSTVGWKEGFQCKAWSNGGKCGNCRACWDPTVKNVNYRRH